MLRKKILVLEGPAGAGKSHAIQWFNQYHPEVPVLERRKEVNGFRSYDSEYWPLTMDLDYLVTALFRPEDAFLVDRFWVNSLVYQPFRYPLPAGEDPDTWPDPKNVNVALWRLVTTANTIIKTAGLRDWNLGFPVDFHISYHILIPHRDILTENRKGSGKTYPFDPAVETLRYLRVAYGGRNQNEGPVTVTLKKHLIQTYADYHEVQNEMDRELVDWRKNNHA